MTPSPEIERGPHLWGARLFATALSLHSGDPFIYSRFFFFSGTREPAEDNVSTAKGTVAS